MNQLVKTYENQVYPLKQGMFCGKTTDAVYVIYNSITKLYKIGITGDIDRRIAELQNQSGCLLNLFSICELECEIDESPKIVEHFLHEYFKSKRILGEWFKLNFCDFYMIHQLFIRITS